MTKNININADRLWHSLMEMAKVGATENGGNCRLALSDLDKEARDLFVEWCEDAGCSISVDAIGNIFARRPGKNNTLPSVMAGSHLDTQPTGGRFDGVLGVLSVLEIIRTLNDRNIETSIPIDAVCWTNEEGSRFAPSMMGSGVHAGVFDLDSIKASTDIDGNLLGQELRRIGYAGTQVPGEQKARAYFELHIEQGPILEESKKTIGVVTGAQGQQWLEIHVTGTESHAGPTPMPRRRDALVGASKIIQEVNRIGLNFAPNACTTVGMIKAYPNSRNVIPGYVFLTVDLRHPKNGTLSKMTSNLKTFCSRLATSDKLKIEITDLVNFPAVSFNSSCIATIREGAKLLGLPYKSIVSGAGHDAVYMARVTPSGMIFIPCKDGISHNEVESASYDDCASGCNVLLHAILQLAESPH